MLQRHRFGRRAETLPINQLELALEDVQQEEAAQVAGVEAHDPPRRADRAAKRRSNRGSLSEHLPRIEMLVEVEIRGLEPDARQAKSRPLVEAMEPWLRAKLAIISQKTKLAEAIRYALARLVGLTPFLADGRMELDYNTAERSIRPLALTRR